MFDHSSYFLAFRSLLDRRRDGFIPVFELIS